MLCVLCVNVLCALTVEMLGAACEPLTTIPPPAPLPDERKVKQMFWRAHCHFRVSRFVGMILILIFAEALGLYGLIVAIILSQQSQDCPPALAPPPAAGPAPTPIPTAGALL